MYAVIDEDGYFLILSGKCTDIQTDMYKAKLAILRSQKKELREQIEIIDNKINDIEQKLQNKTSI